MAWKHRGSAAEPIQNSITEGVIWRNLLTFFFPILLGTFFQQLYNTVDAIIVGNFVGTQALAAVGGATGTIINLLVGFFVGLSAGATVIISQYYGARRAAETSQAVHTSVALGIAGGLFFMVLGMALSPWALRAMGTPEDVMKYATVYIEIYFGGMVFNLLGSMFGTGVLGAILFLLVFLVGHALNFGINVLGAYVHTNRLQYVEFFGKFYEGGGREFKPFKADTKYVKVKEN